MLLEGENVEKRIENFMQEFKNTVEKRSNVGHVKFFGSILTDNWKQGISDVDIIVYGDNINRHVKSEIRLLLRTLNDTYKLELENVRCCHPTPFFLDSPQRIRLFEDMTQGHSDLIQIGREILKQNAPTYGRVWDMEDDLKNFEKNLPHFVPRISEIFDKFS